MENKNGKEVRVISLLNEEKYENCVRELIPLSVDKQNIIDGNNNVVCEYNTFVFYPDINKKLNKGMMANSLIYTHNIRGIGKTTTLVNFAKEHNLYILCVSLTQKNILKNNYNFSNACTVHEVASLRQYEGAICVVDEEFTIDEIKELRDKKGINIITGFINTLESKIIHQINNNNNNNENQYHADINRDELVGMLNYEIKELLSKLRKTRGNNDMGTYKNLVQALTNVLNAKQSVKENNYNNFEREKELGILEYRLNDNK